MKAVERTRGRDVEGERNMKIYMEGERERVIEEERDSETEIKRMKERE